MEWLYGLVVATIIALQSYILLKLITLEIQLVELRVQVGRLVSDTESEKGTRKRIHDDFESRLRNLEKYARSN